MSRLEVVARFGVGVVGALLAGASVALLAERIRARWG